MGCPPVFPFSSRQARTIPCPVGFPQVPGIKPLSHTLYRTVTTINGPTPLVAAYFVILAEIIRRLGPCYSRLKPKLCASLLSCLRDERPELKLIHRCDCIRHRRSCGFNCPGCWWNPCVNRGRERQKSREGWKDHVGWYCFSVVRHHDIYGIGDRVRLPVLA